MSPQITHAARLRARVRASQVPISSAVTHGRRRAFSPEMPGNATPVDAASTRDARRRALKMQIAARRDARTGATPSGGQRPVSAPIDATSLLLQMGVDDAGVLATARGLASVPPRALRRALSCTDAQHAAAAQKNLAEEEEEEEEEEAPPPPRATPLSD